MKTYIGRIFVILFLLTAGLAGSASAYYDGRYIDWTIEEYNGWSWKPLSTWPDNQDSDRRCDEYDFQNRPDECIDDVFNKHKDQQHGGEYADFQEFRIQPTLGKKYRIRVTNLTECRLAVVVDVDGKNSINSRNVSGTSGDAAWVLDRNTTINVKGFQSGSNTAMEFYWTERGDAHSDRPDKLGAIKMYVYFEDGYCARETLENDYDSHDGGRSLAREKPGATGAGNEVYNPVHWVNFKSYSKYPLEKVSVTYDNRRKDDGRDGYGHYSNCFTGIGVEGSTSGYTGIYLNEVYMHGPAWNAGIRAGDKIVKVAGKNVNSIQAMKNITTRMSPGDYVVIKYVHKGKTMTSGVSLDTICP